MDLLALFDGLDPPVTRVDFIDDSVRGEHCPVRGMAMRIHAGGKVTAHAWRWRAGTSPTDVFGGMAAILREAHQQEFHGGGCEKGVWVDHA